MARYKSKNKCKCGRNTIEHRNLCIVCFRIKNTKAVNKCRGKVKPEEYEVRLTMKQRARSMFQQETEDIYPSVHSLETICPKEVYRIDPIYIIER